MTWILTLASLAGVVLNIYKDPLSFKIWMVTNFCWMVIDARKGIIAQAVLFDVYCCLSVWGILAWR